MSYAQLPARLLALVLTAAAVAACADANDPTALAPDAPSLASSGPVLVECPVDYTISTSGRLGAIGGAIGLEKHQLAVPALAITSPNDFTVAAPSSNYMELAVNAEGHSGFNFKRPVQITIDYSRCSRSNIDKAPLSVWHIDGDTKALLENMGGVDDKQSRTVTFTTDHLSHFSIAQQQ